MEMRKIITIMAFLIALPVLALAGSFGSKSKPEIKKGPYISWDDDPQTTMTISWETSVPGADVTKSGNDMRARS